MSGYALRKTLAIRPGRVSRSIEIAAESWILDLCSRMPRKIDFLLEMQGLILACAFSLLHLPSTIYQVWPIRSSLPENQLFADHVFI